MRTPLAWPTLERLAYRNDLPRVRAIKRWAALVCPDRFPEAGNDNDIGIDSRHGIRPGEGELMRAIGCEPNGKAWSETYRRPMPTYSEPTARPIADGPTVHLGALKFRDGELLSYGTPTGKSFKPAERHGPAKGAESKERSDASVRRYLALRGATAEPGGLRRPMSGAPANIGQRDWEEPYDKAIDREMCRYQLAAHGVSRHFTLAQARKNAGLPKSDRGPDFILPGRQWTGGITHARGRGECSTGAPCMRDAENMERRIELAQMRDQLGHHALVLDMAVSPASAAQIAEARGYAPSTARKVGTALTDKAIDALIALEAANENNFKKSAA